jgi:serine protease Do
MGLSFAIPINMAMDVVAQLKRQGHVSRGYLGVQIQDVDRELAEAFGLDRPKGALVVHVALGSPADLAGVQVGDVVLEVEGVRLSDADSLPMLIGRLPPGKDAYLTLMRNRDVIHLTVKLVERPEAASIDPQIAPLDAPLLPSRTPARAAAARLLPKALI